MSNRHFWDTLRSILESRPGIQPPFFDDKKSLDDLRRYTLTILRAHATWLAPSWPRFNYRTVKLAYQWSKNEVLPGGRWLFGLDKHELAVVDLDSGAHYSFLKSPDPGEARALDTFQFSFKEGVYSSFWLALFNGVRWKALKNFIYIYQMDYCTDRHPPFQATHLTTIWDIGTDHGPRDSVQVTDRYIFQCYSLWEENRDELLQIRCFSTDPSVSEKFVELSVVEGARISDHYHCVSRLLPHDRLAVIVLTAIKIYAIVDSSDKALPDLHLLHQLDSDMLFRGPLLDKGVYIWLVLAAVQPDVFISATTLLFHRPLKFRLKSGCGPDKSSRSLVSFSHEGPHLYGFEMGTYDLTWYPSDYRWLLLNDFPLFKHNVAITEIVGLDDNVGRLVLWCTDDPFVYGQGPSEFSYFLIMDII